MKLVQFWRNGRPALGLQTERGVVDAAAEATRLGVTVPEDMAAAIALPAGELERLLTPLLQDPQCFTGAPLPRCCSTSFPTLWLHMGTVSS